ncbi:uncharacterized protein LOC107617097 [Arachis ipaensis]|uniref:uncharacterized protein LOC107617097 n=1 Tax=Arachis ipaensis TaxID=130454 RepID=UPI000A2B6F78|nr:uncharacterized protein LOC107617097 [Arachis ipaensis]
MREELPLLLNRRGAPSPSDPSPFLLPWWWQCLWSPENHHYSFSPAPVSLGFAAFHGETELVLPPSPCQLVLVSPNIHFMLILICQNKLLLFGVDVAVGTTAGSNAIAAEATASSDFVILVQMVVIAFNSYPI